MQLEVNWLSLMVVMPLAVFGEPMALKQGKNTTSVSCLRNYNVGNHSKSEYPSSWIGTRPVLSLFLYIFAQLCECCMEFSLDINFSKVTILDAVDLPLKGRPSLYENRFFFTPNKAQCDSSPSIDKHFAEEMGRIVLCIKPQITSFKLTECSVSVTNVFILYIFTSTLDCLL